MTDLTQLEAEIAQKQAELNAAQLPALVAATTALNHAKVGAALTALQENIGGLRGERAQQANNLIVVLTSSIAFLNAERAAIEAAQAGGGETETPEGDAQ